MQRNKYLLTGAHGFLGEVILKTLSANNDVVVTLGRSPANNYVVDLSTEIPRFKESFEVVIHNAGKAHFVPKSETERKAFYDTNVQGTRNLLDAISASGTYPRAIVFISTIAVYGLTTGENIAENHPLNATDPYGKSKIQAEQLLVNWCSQHHVSLVILRLPLVAGKNPPGNLGTMIRAIKKGYYFGIGKSSARKSIVMAEDVAKAIPGILNHPGIYNLTDGYHPSFRELELVIAAQAECSPPRNIPAWVAKIIGLTGDALDKILPGKSPVTTVKIEKITSTLTFDDQKARKVLNWQPQKVIDAFRIS